MSNTCRVNAGRFKSESEKFVTTVYNAPNVSGKHSATPMYLSDVIQDSCNTLVNLLSNPPILST